MTKKCIVAVVLAACLCMSSCDYYPKDSYVNRDIFNPPPDSLSATIFGYNHTDEHIHTFYVGGRMGPNISPHNGGGSTTCCATFPKKWSEGHKVKVEWISVPVNPVNYRREEHTFEKMVTLGQYGPTGGSMQVHFLPNKEVVIIVSDLFEGHPDYPGPKLILK